MQKVFPVALVLLLGGQNGIAESVQSQASGSVVPAPASASSASSGSSSGPSPIARSDTGVKSGVASPYYTNDFTAFLAQAAAAAAAAAPSKPDARLSSGSGSGSSQSAAGSSIGGIPYQTLIQALAAGVAPSASASAGQPSASASAPAASWASPSSWINSGSGLWSMFSKPSTLVNNQRRSSLTSRLRSFMNALFYR